MAEKIYLGRLRDDGITEPYEIWTAEMASKMSLNREENNEVCKIMDDIKDAVYHQETCVYWLYDGIEMDKKHVCLDKILNYLHHLKYETCFVSRNNMDIYRYRIDW